MYLTCGDASAQADFTRNVAPVPVATKTDLLTAEDLFALMALSDQQRALVDALVAERAGYVLAPDGSTASWALALRRAAARVPGPARTACAAGIVTGRVRVRARARACWRGAVSCLRIPRCGGTTLPSLLATARACRPT